MQMVCNFNLNLFNIYDFATAGSHYFTRITGLYSHLMEKLKSNEWAMSQELRKHKEKELEQCELMLKVSLTKFNASLYCFLSSPLF